MVEIEIVARPGCKAGSQYFPVGTRVWVSQRIADDLVAQGSAVYAAAGRRKRK